MVPNLERFLIKRLSAMDMKYVFKPFAISTGLVESVSLILICVGILVCKVFLLFVIVLIKFHVVFYLLSDCDISLL